MRWKRVTSSLPARTETRCTRLSRTLPTVSRSQRFIPVRSSKRGNHFHFSAMSEEKALLKSFDPRAGIILVTATIYGRVDLKARLVFDTGATYCMLPHRIINALDIKINPKNVTQTTTASAVETSPIVKLPVVEVLNEKVENVTCLVRDLPPMSNIDGLLGLSFLKHFNVHIDFEEGELFLDRY